MAKTDRLEKLFQDFFQVSYNSFQQLEMQFNITGVMDQVFGKDTDEQQAKNNLRESKAWKTLSTLFDYAVNGIDYGDASSVVIDGSDVLKLVCSEEYWVSDEWFDIVNMADGRYALDDGMSVPIPKIAALANVEIRTVRNAISAGELVCVKNTASALVTENNDEEDVLCAENASARRWLHGRRGFKPTVLQDDSVLPELAQVDTPKQFGKLLKTQRERLGLNDDTNKLAVFHPSVNPSEISRLESGVFALPLDAVFPIADFYQVSRVELLSCVMRIFFPDELAILSKSRIVEAIKS